MRLHTRLRTACIAAILFLGLQDSFAQNKLTLDDCLNAVRAAAPDTKQLAVTDAMLQQQQKINGLQYWPQASLNGKATWQSDVTEIAVDVPGFEFTPPDKDQYAFTLDLMQPIYDGGTTSAKNAVLQDASALSTLQSQQAIQSTEELATNLFYNIALQQQLVYTDNLLITQLNQVVTSLENNYAAGVVDRAAVLQAKVKLKESLQKKEEAETLKALAKSSLAILIDRDTSAFEVDPQPVTPSLPDTVFGHRAEMQILDAHAQLIQSQEHLSHTQYHPRLSAFVTLGYGKPALNFLSNTFDTYAIAGLNVNIPLSQFYTRKTSREDQVFQLQQEAVALSRDNVQRNLHVMALQHTSEIDKLNAWVTEDEEMIAMREDMLKTAEARHNAGTITLSDYLDALTDLSLARERKVNHEIMLQHEQALLNQLYGIPNVTNQ